MSMTPTAGSAARNNSGRCARQAPTRRPPLLPPPTASWFGFVIRRSELNPRLPEDRASVVARIIAKNCRGGRETGERIERFVIRAFAAKSTGVANPRQCQFSQWLSLHVEDFDFGMGVFEI